MDLSIADIVIDPDVPTVSFACDLKACRGACCTIPGGRGAPLEDDEVELIAAALPVIRPHLSERHRDAIDAHGAVEGTPGDYHTACIDNRACVFVVFENDVAKCSIEQAYFRGESAWRKPLSCHLFPIRLDRHPVPRVRFEYIAECAPAVRRGSSQGVRLVSFVSEALKRAFGDAWPSIRDRLDR